MMKTHPRRGLATDHQEALWRLKRWHYLVFPVLKSLGSWDHATIHGVDHGRERIYWCDYSRVGLNATQAVSRVMSRW
jgi:hypothetical protein